MKLSSLVIIALALGAFAAGCASGTDPDDFDAGRLVGVDTGPGGPRVDASGPPRDAGIDARFDAGQDAGVCVPTCTSDFDCQNSCPANPLGVNCCDRGTSMCYRASMMMCPVPTPDSGMTMPY